MSGKNDKVQDQDRYSIISPMNKCWVCGSDYRLQIHEVFYGVSNRKLSKEDGMVVALCRDHHQGTFGVHNNKELDLHLKQHAEKVWLSKLGDIDQFIKRYGRNYLD